MRPLPYITADLPSIGGEIKTEPADFMVQEIPLYEPTGTGEHLYVCITREGWTTPALQKQLIKLFHLNRVDVGYAGLKDKHARSTQVFSLYTPNLDELSVTQQIQDNLPVKVEWICRHRNKLKKGHLIGNGFRILVRNPEPDAFSRAETIAKALQSRGLPNFYGEQRFGITGENARKGREVLRGRGPRDRWTRRFVLAALQAELFNLWLTERMGLHWFDRLLKGDIAKKVDTGGIFEVEDLMTDAIRFQQRKITYTGPVYGWRMRWASGEPGGLERQILQEAQMNLHMLRQVHLDGSRRPGRIFVDELNLERHPLGLIFTFSLPKAAYATTLLREFMKIGRELP
jgi:tRNA pseudouridine13 synthase